MRSLSGRVQNTRTNAYILEETKLSVKLEYCCCEIDNKGKRKYFMNPVSGVDSFNLIFSLKEASMRRMNTYTCLLYTYHPLRARMRRRTEGEVFPPHPPR